MVLVFLAEGFEEIEALTAVDLLRREKIDVRLVGVGAETVTGAHGIKVVTDVKEEDVSALLPDVEMVVLPGGMPGTLNLGASETVKNAVSATAEKGGFVCAICAAPSVLGDMGLLDGRMATCFPGYEDRLKGAQTYDCDVIRDGEFITGRAMGSATEFALELVGALKGDDEAERLREAIIA